MIGRDPPGTCGRCLGPWGRAHESSMPGAGRQNTSVKFQWASQRDVYEFHVEQNAMEEG